MSRRTLSIVVVGVVTLGLAASFASAWTLEPILPFPFQILKGDLEVTRVHLDATQGIGALKVRATIRNNGLGLIQGPVRVEARVSWPTGNRTVSVVLPLNLSSGYNQDIEIVIYAYGSWQNFHTGDPTVRVVVDPPTTTKPAGDYDERNERNNGRFAAFRRRSSPYLYYQMWFTCPI